MLSDAELVAQVRAGRRDAFGGLVRRHQTALYRHACGMGLDHDTSLDLVQDTFVRAYTRLDECRTTEQFRFWLFRIGRNLCLDYLKSVRRLTIPLSSLLDCDAIPATTSPNDEMQFVLQAALKRLPVALREAFLLKHDAEYTYEELAELTNSSPSAVKMRVHRAREALQKYLDEMKVRAA